MQKEMSKLLFFNKMDVMWLDIKYTTAYILICSSHNAIIGLQKNSKYTTRLLRNSYCAFWEWAFSLRLISIHFHDSVKSSLNIIAKYLIWCQTEDKSNRPEITRVV